jgi:hypothetical protein
MGVIMVKKLINCLSITTLFLAPAALAAADLQPIEIKIKETNRIQQVIDDNKKPQQIAKTLAIFTFGMLIADAMKSNYFPYYELPLSFAFGLLWPATLKATYSILEGNGTAMRIILGVPYTAGAFVSTYGMSKLINNYLSNKNKEVINSELPKSQGITC